jgi:hypothetical protein
LKRGFDKLVLNYYRRKSCRGAEISGCWLHLLSFQLSALGCGRSPRYASSRGLSLSGLKFVSNEDIHGLLYSTSYLLVHASPAREIDEKREQNDECGDEDAAGFQEAVRADRKATCLETGAARCPLLRDSHDQLDTIGTAQRRAGCAPTGRRCVAVGTIEIVR